MISKKSMHWLRRICFLFRRIGYLFFFAFFIWFFLWENHGEDNLKTVGGDVFGKDGVRSFREVAKQSGLWVLHREENVHHGFDAFGPAIGVGEVLKSEGEVLKRKKKELVQVSVGEHHEGLREEEETFPLLLWEAFALFDSRFARLVQSVDLENLKAKNE